MRPEFVTRTRNSLKATLIEKTFSKENYNHDIWLWDRFFRFEISYFGLDEKLSKMSIQYFHSPEKIGIFFLIAPNFFVGWGISTEDQLCLMMFFRQRDI